MQMSECVTQSEPNVAPVSNVAATGPTPSADVCLSRIFEKVRQGRYALAPAADINVNALCGALASAFGKEVTRIVFVSASAPRGDVPEGFSEREMGDEMAETLREKYLTQVESVLGADEIMPIWNELWSRLHDPTKGDLRKSIEATFGGEPMSSERGRLCNTAWGDVWSCAFYLTCTSRMGSNCQEAERIVALANQLQNCIPLAESRNQPGVWLVLAS